jgi:hypothetical protein
MRLAEFASFQDQLELWKLISDAVWSKLGSQSQQQQQPPPAPTSVSQPPLPKPRKKAIKPKKTAARKINIPKPLPPKPLARPKPLYPNKTIAAKPNPVKAKPDKLAQTAQQSAKPTKASSPAANPNTVTRGIAAMNAPAQISNLRNTPVLP